MPHVRTWRFLKNIIFDLELPLVYRFNVFAMEYVSYGMDNKCLNVLYLSVIRHHDEHQGQEEGDQVHV